MSFALVFDIQMAMRERMDQAEIDALLKDSMFSDSEVRESHQSHQIHQSKHSEADSYANDEFESYEDSRPTMKNQSRTQLNESKKPPARKGLQAIKEEGVVPERAEDKRGKPPKAGIYFEPKKERNSSQERKPSNLPYNYARISERERELLLTTLTQQNLQLKESLRVREGDYKKLDSAYQTLLKQKAQEAPSVREATLQKQLASMQAKYERLQEVLKAEKAKRSFKAGKTQETFVAEREVSGREEELCGVIEQLRERLLATTNELRTLQGKMNEGQDYVEELRRKLRRVEQLEFKLERMGEQAENDRAFIEALRDKNRKLDSAIGDLEREKRVLEIEVHRLKLGDSTQKDCFQELEAIRKEKEALERNLRELTSNLMGKVRAGQRGVAGMEDSGELLRP